MPVAETAAVNASPLICLCRAGLSDLLRLAAEMVVVPASVAREILARGPGDLTAGVLIDSPWLKQVEDPVISLREHRRRTQGLEFGPGAVQLVQHGRATTA